MRLEELQVYQLSMDIGERIWKIVMKWDYFTKDTVGKQLWIKPQGGSNIALDDFGNIYISGVDGTIKYDNNGNMQWHQTQSCSQIMIDSSGNVYVIGSTVNKGRRTNFVITTKNAMLTTNTSNNNGLAIIMKLTVTATPRPP